MLDDQNDSLPDIDNSEAPPLIPQEDFSVIGTAWEEFGSNIGAIFRQSPIGKVVDWWNDEGIPYDEWSGDWSKQYRQDTGKDWNPIEQLKKRTGGTRFGDGVISPESMVQIFEANSDNRNYIMESTGPVDLNRRISSVLGEMEDFENISEQGAAGWSGWFLANMLADPTNILIGPKLLQLSAAFKQARRVKKVLKSRGGTLTAEEAVAFRKSLNGVPPVSGILAHGALAGVASMGFESYFDDKVTRNDIIFAGATSATLVGLMVGGGALAKYSTNEVLKLGDRYWRDILHHPSISPEVPQEISRARSIENVQKTVTEMQRRLDNGEDYSVIAGGLIRKIRALDNASTYWLRGPISDMQHSTDPVVRATYFQLGRHADMVDIRTEVRDTPPTGRRYDWADEVPLLEDITEPIRIPNESQYVFRQDSSLVVQNVSELSAARLLRINSLFDEASILAKNSPLHSEQYYSALIQVLDEGASRLDADEFSHIPDDVKKQLREFATRIDRKVFGEYRELGEAVGLAAPKENYFPHVGRRKELIDMPDRQEKFLEKAKKHYEENGFSPEKAVIAAEKSLSAIIRGAEPPAAKLGFHLGEDGHVTAEISNRDIEEPGTAKERTIDLPYRVMAMFYDDPSALFRGNLRRSNADTNAVILAALSEEGTAVTLPKLRPAPVEGEAPGTSRYPLESRERWHANADYEARNASLVEMTPDEFLSRTKPLTIDEVTLENIAELKGKMERGEPLDPLTIYRDDLTDVRASDGRHRAIAAKELGMDSVPVLDFTSTPRTPRPVEGVVPEGEGITVYHGSVEQKKSFTGGEFFTDEVKEATEYAKVAAISEAMDRNPTVLDIVSEVMAEDGADELSDLSLATLDNILSANNLSIGDVGVGGVSKVRLKFENPADLTDYGSSVGSREYVGETWDKLHRDGYVEGKWSELDQEIQEEIIADYADKAIYKLFEKEGVYQKAFDKGHDAIIFDDQGISGETVHKSYLVKDPSQVVTRTPTHTDDLNYEVIPQSAALRKSRMEGGNPQDHLADFNENIDAHKAATQTAKDAGSIHQRLRERRQELVQERMTVRQELTEEVRNQFDTRDQEILDSYNTTVDAENKLIDLEDVYDENAGQIADIEVWAKGLKEDVQIELVNKLDLQAARIDEGVQVPEVELRVEIEKVGKKIETLMSRKLKRIESAKNKAEGRILYSERSVNVSEARVRVLRWRVGGRKDTPDYKRADANKDIKYLEENLPEKSLRKFASRDHEKMLPSEEKAATRAAEQLEKVQKDLEDFKAPDLSPSDLKKLEELTGELDFLRELDIEYQGRPPAQWSNKVHLETSRQIKALRKLIDGWGDPLSPSPEALAHIGGRRGGNKLGRGENALDFDGAVKKRADLLSENSANHNEIVELESRIERLTSKLDSDTDNQKLQRWLRRKGNTVDPRVKSLTDEIAATRVEIQEAGIARRDARADKRKADRDYRETFGRRPGKEVTRSQLNTEISTVRHDSAIGAMSLGVAERNGQYVFLDVGFGGKIKRSFEKRIEEAPEKVSVKDRMRGVKSKDDLTREMNLTASRMAALRDSLIGQEFSSTSTAIAMLRAMNRFGSGVMTAPNIAINSSMDISVAIANSDSGLIRGLDATTRGIIARAKRTWGDAPTPDEMRTITQMVEAAEKEIMSNAAQFTRDPGGASLEGTIAVPETHKGQEALGKFEGVSGEVWKYGSLFAFAQPVVRGTAARLHTTRALDIGEKIALGEVLTPNESHYVLRMGMTEQELGSSYLQWSHFDHNKTSATGLREASPGMWRNQTLGEKFENGVIVHVEETSVRPRKEDLAQQIRTPGNEGAVRTDIDRAVEMVTNTLQGFPSTVSKLYGDRAVQSLVNAGGIANAAMVAKRGGQAFLVWWALDSIKEWGREAGIPDLERRPKRTVGDRFLDTLMGTGISGKWGGRAESFWWTYTRATGGRPMKTGDWAWEVGRQVAPGAAGAANSIVGLGELVISPPKNEREWRRYLRVYGAPFPIPLRPGAATTGPVMYLLEWAKELGFVKPVPGSTVEVEQD